MKETQNTEYKQNWRNEYMKLYLNTNHPDFKFLLPNHSIVIRKRIRLKSRKGCRKGCRKG